MGKAFLLADAAWELDQGSYVTAIVLGALDVGTGGKGRVVSAAVGKSLTRTIGRIANRLNVIVIGSRSCGSRIQSDGC